MAPPSKKRLQATAIERLENTSFAVFAPQDLLAQAATTPADNPTVLCCIGTFCSMRVCCTGCTYPPTGIDDLPVCP